MAKSIFVAFSQKGAMHYDSLLDIVWEAAARVSKEIGEEVATVGPTLQLGKKPSEVLAGIADADVVITEGGSRNPNVMLEVGHAQARSKPMIILAHDPGDVPFYLQDYPVVLYEGSMPGYRAPRLAEALKDILSPPPRKSPSQTREKQSRTVFISYSHRDAAYLQRVLIHLRPLERAGVIDAWSDARLTAGDWWKDEIRQAVERARIAVLLISADFVASEFIVTNELPPLLSAAQTKGTRIVPIILKPSRFLRDQSLNKFLALNDPATPVIAMSEMQQEELYAKLAEVIEIEVGFPRSTA